MKRLCIAYFSALLVLGLAGVQPTPAQAAGTWDPSCNCHRPDSSYSTKRVVRGAPRVVTQHRYVNRTRVLPGQRRLIQENRLVVHERPVVKRTVVVHRTNTVYKDIVVRRVNTTHKSREVFGGHQVVHRHEPGTVRRVTEHRTIQGRDCNCYGNRHVYREATYRY